MPAVRLPPGTDPVPAGSVPGEPVAAAFLPLTLAELAATSGSAALADDALAAELAAEDSWYALLGNCSVVRRTLFDLRLHELSLAAGRYAGDGWWSGDGRAHRDRVTEFELWAVEALAEGDGEEFAEACAGYDAALARALAAARELPREMPDPTAPGGHPAR
ncbi:MAG TPA: hypothetical protein VGH99_01580 [Pseudonocardia sp.]|jgi:hypothetical protein